MEITKKIFWTEAMKGGTIIGLTTVAFAILQYAVQLQWINFVQLVVFGLLLLGFTRRIAKMADVREGFPYGRCMGFVIAMMLFVGVINGVYLSVMFNFVTPETVVEVVDSVMVGFQDVIPSDNFDSMYDSFYSIYRSPITLVIASIIAYVIQGGVFGLFTSVFAQRKPNIFAEQKKDDSEYSDNGAE